MVDSEQDQEGTWRKTAAALEYGDERKYRFQSTQFDHDSTLYKCRDITKQVLKKMMERMELMPP